MPVRTAYNQWTQFEEFPRFMEAVKRVAQLDDTSLEWTAELAGVERSWRAEISEQEPDEVVAWRSTSGAKNAGRVTFETLDANRTRITLELEVEPADRSRRRRRAGFSRAPGGGRPTSVQGSIEQRGTATGACEVRSGRQKVGNTDESESREAHQGHGQPAHDTVTRLGHAGGVDTDTGGPGAT